MALRTPDAPSTSGTDIEAGVIKDARQRQRRHRIAWILPTAAAIIAGLILALNGGGGGSNRTASTHPLRLDAEFIREVEQATAAKPGTIVVSIVRHSLPSTPNPLVTEEVLETPTGPGPQNYLNGNLPGQPSDFALSDGVQEIYLRKRDTVYVRSIWGPYIHKGRTPGTFIYRRPKDTFSGTSYPQSRVDGSLPPKPLRLTPAQAHALLDGSDKIVPTGNLGRGPSKLTSVPRVASLVGLRSFVNDQGVRIVGPTTVDGRRVIELAGPKFKYNPHNVNLTGEAGVKFWIDAKTYTPIKEVTDRPPVDQSSETWLEYKTVPITAANQRLLSPLALHPHAHVDRNYRDYVNATYNWAYPQGSTL